MRTAAVVIPASPKLATFACALILWARANFDNVLVFGAGDPQLVMPVLTDPAGQLLVLEEEPSDDYMTVDGFLKLYPKIRDDMILNNVTDIVVPFNLQSVPEYLAGIRALDSLRAFCLHYKDQGGGEAFHAPFAESLPTDALFPSTQFPKEKLTQPAKKLFSIPHEATPVVAAPVADTESGEVNDGEDDRNFDEKNKHH